ncbi:MAG: DNA methylase, partial [Oscillospiraceae bacterium]|nr:DNA methylase [Oscillospiraceae bacterium]
GDNFAQSMIDIYTNLTNHMPDDGMQIVMFTHSDPAVWAQLALIMWKASLKVTAAWNIATETDASGLKDGNYVKGTVLLVLRKCTGTSEAFLDEINADIKHEVIAQIESMQTLDDKEDPNFSDPDYVLAAYAASLKVLTSYSSIGEIDLDYELDKAINDPKNSKVVALIERAKKQAYDCIIPADFDNFLWKELTPSERFYIKGLENEKNGGYQISTYQEYARGFAITSYSQLMANERANTCRLKTPTEFAMRTVGDVPGFEESTLRLVLAAVHVAIKEDEKPDKGLWHIKNNLADYWSSRDMVKQLLRFLKDTRGIANMQHWAESAQMAEHLYVLVDNDHV